MTPPLVRNSVLLTLVLVQSMACREFELEGVDEDYARQTDPNCFPEEDSSLRTHIPGTAYGSDYGAAFTVVEMGPQGAASGPRVAAISAPLRLRMGAMGSIFLHQTSGAALVSSPRYTLHAPTSSGIYSMGEAMAAANVEETHAVYTPAGSSTWGDGFELLAGAPGLPGDDEAGWLTWWQTSYPLGADTTSPDVYTWHYGGEWRPSSAASDAHFGASLVVDPHNCTSVVYPDYIAVGAPGEQKVYVLEPNTSSGASSRFSVVSTIVPDSTEAGLATDFGGTLLLRDLNGDGWEDLVIGAPTGTSGNTGYAYVLPGTTPTAGYFDTANKVVVQPTWPTASSAPDDGFGQALAAGPVSGPSGDVESLVVGAPNLDLGGVSNAGGLCVLTFQYDGSTGVPTTFSTLTSECYENPYASLALSDMQWGAALVVANVVPYDAFSSKVTDYGRASELVVGCPGCPKIDVDGSWNWTAPTPQDGSIFVYGSTDGDPWILDACTGGDDQWLAQLLPTLGAGFPSGLATFDVERNGALDLVVLQASEDQVQLTQQVEVNGIDEPLAGLFAAPDDADGDAPMTMSVQDMGDGTIRLDVLSQFTMTLGKDDGAGGWDLCTSFGDVPEDEEMLPLALGEVTAPVPGDPPIEVELTLSGEDKDGDGEPDEVYIIFADLSFEENNPSIMGDDAYILSFNRAKKDGGLFSAYTDCELIIDGDYTEDVAFSRLSVFQCEY